MVFPPTEKIRRPVCGQLLYTKSTICCWWPGLSLPFEGEKVAVSLLLDTDHFSRLWWSSDSVSTIIHLYLPWANVQPIVALKWSGLIVSPGIGDGVGVATATVAATPAGGCGVACMVLFGKKTRGNTKKNRLIMMTMSMRVTSTTTPSSLEL